MTATRQALDIIDAAHKAVVAESYGRGFWSCKESVERVTRASTALVHAMFWVSQNRVD